ncbi:hypothetical protein L2E82_15798 [Cichorium intybus]|uniref:Uncharacterized protein n=1 Tax=Cichorium intybus TaxID=13427 RepID=A0ACB9F4C4_CICIN|nr:hypothetical protein L2E82_15798 [Cichorium intybus]
MYTPSSSRNDSLKCLVCDHEVEDSSLNGKVLGIYNYPSNRFDKIPHDLYDPRLFEVYEDHLRGNTSPFCFCCRILSIDLHVYRKKVLLEHHHLLVHLLRFWICKKSSCL